MKKVSLVFLFYSFLYLSAHAQVSGLVYADFNGNGVRSLTAPNEYGIEGVTVSAFTSTSSVPIKKVTDAEGSFSFSAAEIPAGTKVRVEFSNYGEKMFEGLIGTQNGTNVQFLTAPSSNVSLGVYNLNLYCPISLPSNLATPCYVNGDPLKGGSAGEEDVLVNAPYMGTGLSSPTNFPVQKLAKGKQMGALWGLTFQLKSKRLLASAITRRHAGLGPLGTGGVYMLDFKNKVTPVSNFIDVKVLGINTGEDPHAGGLPADMLEPNRDAGLMATTAKVGIGDIELGLDQKTVYLVNLYDKKLYSFDAGLPFKTPTLANSNVKSWAIPNPGCPNNDYAPWGVTLYNGNYYLGVTCTAETSKDPKELKAVVYRFHPDSTQKFTEIFSMPLDYKKGVGDATGDCPKIDHWMPWTSEFPKPCFIYPEGNTNHGHVLSPQALLSDVAFDDNGDLLIGLTDRFGFQVGQKNYSPDPTDFNLYSGFLSGDLLRASLNSDGTYTLESNGIVGGRTGTGVGNGEGPGGGEFYGDDYWIYYGGRGHSEITNGAMVVMPGYGEVVASAMDPVEQYIYAGGSITFDNKTGAKKRGFALYSDVPGTLGKASGIGDIVITCDGSDFQIGNRVWLDTNRNGIQDPNEAGINGIVISLCETATGKEIGRDTTSNGGLYYFDETNITQILLPKTDYTVKLCLDQVPGFALTPHDQVSSATVTNNDLIDSDAVSDNSKCGIITFQLNKAIETNYSLDFGIYEDKCPDKICLPFMIAKTK